MPQSGLAKKSFKEKYLNFLIKDASNTNANKQEKGTIFY